MCDKICLYSMLFMREVLTAEVNFAIVSIYVTRRCSGSCFWDVLLGVLGRQTVHWAQQAQQAKQQSQYVGGSGPTVTLWPMNRAAGADKTQICWVPWSQSWPSIDLTCSQNTKKSVGCAQRDTLNSLPQLFYKFTGSRQQ